LLGRLDDRREVQVYLIGGSTPTDRAAAAVGRSPGERRECIATLHSHAELDVLRRELSVFRIEVRVVVSAVVIRAAVQNEHISMEQLLNLETILGGQRRRVLTLRANYPIRQNADNDTDDDERR